MTARKHRTPSPNGAVPEGLTPEHYRTLFEGSGISREVVEERGYFSLRQECGARLRDLGFSEGQVAAASLPAFAFPVMTTTGDVGYWQVRPDAPSNPRHKYATPRGTRNRLDVHPRSRPHLRNPRIPLWITEGVKKGDALVSAGAQCVVALPGGVWGWRGTNEFDGKTTLADWDDVALNGRHVYLVFDSDLATNRQVRAALDRMAAMLAQRGARVWLIFLPAVGDGKVGVDDYLLSHDLEELQELAKTVSEVQAEDPMLTLPRTDHGAAERFAAAYGDRLAWCSEARTWYVWDGRRWDTRPTERPTKMAMDLGRELQAKAVVMNTSNIARADTIAYALSFESAKRINTTVELAKALLEVEAREFDSDPFLLNVTNGVVDLRTGELLPHDPDLRQTAASPVTYDPDAAYEEWEHFLDQATEGKEGLREFLQVAAGYSVTGSVAEEKLFMAIGPSRSGKSTFLEAIKSALGDYAATSNFDTFAAKSFEQAHSEGIARLRGRRFVTSIEVEQGRTLAVALVNQLTGGDELTARMLYANSVTFAPTQKYWIAANNEPKVAKDEDAIWNRILRVPFANVVPPERRDPGVKERLKDPRIGGPAVLAWLVRGCLTWQREGLKPPQVVLVETAAYRERMDVLNDFIEDRCVLHEGARTPAAELYETYVEWTWKNGVPKAEVLSRQKFGRALERLGCEKRQSKADNTRAWFGVGLLGTRRDFEQSDEVDSSSFRQG